MFADTPADLPNEDLTASVPGQAAEDVTVDLQALAREILALLKEELRLEKDRLGQRLD